MDARQIARLQKRGDAPPQYRGGPLIQAIRVRRRSRHAKTYAFRPIYLNHDAVLNDDDDLPETQPMQGSADGGHD